MQLLEIIKIACVFIVVIQKNTKARCMCVSALEVNSLALFWLEKSCELEFSAHLPLREEKKLESIFSPSTASTAARRPSPQPHKLTYVFSSCLRSPGRELPHIRVS